MKDEPRKRAYAGKHAAAVQYRDNEQLPRVLAAGEGVIASEIVETAKACGIPVQQDETLALVLSQLRPGELIPPETYRLAAELITFLYETDEAWRDKHPFLESILHRQTDEGKVS